MRVGQDVPYVGSSKRARASASRDLRLHETASDASWRTIWQGSVELWGAEALFNIFVSSYVYIYIHVDTCI